MVEIVKDMPVKKECHQLEDQYGSRPPNVIAQDVRSLGVSKANKDGLTLLVLALMAGAFISLGAMFSLVSVAGSEWPMGVTKVLSGVTFCLGLVLTVMAGAELFTSNNLIAMAWASRLVSTRQVARNWTIVYFGNVLGAGATIFLIEACDFYFLAEGGSVRELLVSAAAAKANLSVSAAFFRGVLCNALVCLAVWLAMGGRNSTDKVLGIMFPVVGFVTIGFEHSIANWFYLPFGLYLGGTEVVSASGALQNLFFVTLGNMVGGTLLVAGVYWLAFLRSDK